MSIRPTLAWERPLWSRGLITVAGLDEAGRGAWAGPVVAAVAVLPACEHAPEALRQVRDSKLLSPSQRERCYDAVIATATAYGVGAVPAEEIDRLGIVPATRLAMRRALAQLDVTPEYLLIDALPLPEIALPQRAQPKGDRDCLSIAAASILAKVTRDRWMVALDERLPGYGFGQHKGYGTRQHRDALEHLGTTPYHRHSYAPIRALDEASDHASGSSD